MDQASNDETTEEYAVDLYEAMRKIGTNEKKIIEVLTELSLQERLNVAEKFQKKTNKDLVACLKSELSGNFRSLIVALMTPLDKFYAAELHHAIEGINTKENVLIEILCTLRNDDLQRVKQNYERDYKETLEKDIRGDTSGHFRSFLELLCKAKRNEVDLPNKEKAEEKSIELYKAGEQQLGTDESVFTKTFCCENFEQLKLIFETYEEKYGKSIKQVIKSEFSGDLKEGLLAIVDIAENRQGFFAKQLKKAFKGLGTRNKDLIRIVVTMSESDADMKTIKDEYKKRFDKTLAEAITSDCSGDFKKCLLALIEKCDKSATMI